jgi:peptidoglycan/xylan/chitin deacetylase (PgdA/CDA1 family)
VLIYHRVLPKPDPLRPGDVSAATFRWQMATLARCFHVLPLGEALERLARGSLPSRAAAVTFDDGYADNFEVALPILKEMGIPATFFVTSGTLGGCMWNDEVVAAVRGAGGEGLDGGPLGLGRLPTATDEERWSSLMRLLNSLRTLDRERRDVAVAALREQVGLETPRGLMMTADQVRGLQDAGMAIGGHTVSHPILARTGDAEAEREIGEGREALEGILGERVPLFAYPNGRPGVDYRSEHVAMVRRAGFQGAVSTAWGVNRSGRADPFQIRRFTPWDQTPGRFAGRLLLQGLKGQAGPPSPNPDPDSSAGPAVSESQ